MYNLIFKCHNIVLAALTTMLESHSSARPTTASKQLPYLSCLLAYLLIQRESVSDNTVISSLDLPNKKANSDALFGLRSLRLVTFASMSNLQDLELKLNRSKLTDALSLSSSLSSEQLTQMELKLGKIFELSKIKKKGVTVASEDKKSNLAKLLVLRSLLSYHESHHKPLNSMLSINLKQLSEQMGCQPRALKNLLTCTDIGLQIVPGCTVSGLGKLKSIIFPKSLKSFTSINASNSLNTQSATVKIQLSSYEDIFFHAFSNPAKESASQASKTLQSLRSDSRDGNSFRIAGKIGKILRSSSVSLPMVPTVVQALFVRASALLTDKSENLQVGSAWLKESIFVKKDKPSKTQTGITRTANTHYQTSVEADNLETICSAIAQLMQHDVELKAQELRTKGFTNIEKCIQAAQPIFFDTGICELHIVFTLGTGDQLTVAHEHSGAN